jgi:hypothetical protein
MKINSRIKAFISLIVMLACTVTASAQGSTSKRAATFKSSNSRHTRAKARKTRTSIIGLSAPDSLANSAVATSAVGQMGGLTAQEIKIVGLLQRSPFLDPAPADALGGQDFMIKARSLVPFDADTKSPLATLRALEAKLQSVGSVNAIVSSDPVSLSVQYRRVTDSSLNFNTTTDSVVSLDPPATYVFTCTGPGGAIQSQTVSCATGCRVVFKF